MTIYPKPYSIYLRGAISPKKQVQVVTSSLTLKTLQYKHTYIYIYIFIARSIYIYVYLSVYMSIYLYICIFVYLYIYISTCIEHIVDMLNLGGVFPEACPQSPNPKPGQLVRSSAQIVVYVVYRKLSNMA